jgi:aminopeptidase N
VNGQSVEPRYEQKDSAMVVPLLAPLASGEQAVFAMDFDVAVPTDESSNYGTFAYLRDVLAMAHVYPMIAVYDDEAWNDEIAPPEGDVIYNDASFYLVRIDAPEQIEIASSGVTLDRQVDGDRQVLTMAAGPARDFYFAASGGYEVASQKIGETTVRSYAPANLQAGSRQVLETAAKALQDFAARFGPYPYTELDFVSTGTNALGVEYPGIIAITDRAYEGDYARFLESTTVHEVAHQWFYNEVGNDQIDEPWLDEALAQYATLLYFQDEYGLAGADGFRKALEDRWNRADRMEIPIGMPVAKYANGSYGAIVYGRGPLFFEALREKMGAKAFDAFLRDYVDVNSWGVATTESIRALAEQHCGCDLGELFGKWVDAE